jgi:DNA-binding PadR family transcriptional regulator
MRKLFLGLIQIHILHHAAKEPLYGSWMLEELKEHGYILSPGTLYPILHGLARDGLLSLNEQLVEGKVRKYYCLTQEGELALVEAKQKARELIRELEEE